MGMKTTRTGLVLVGTLVGAVSLAAEAPPADDSLQEIVVTGLRASLEKSIELKKEAAVVMDSINATELGRFPDSDVADSLSHITGISITRTTGGDGQHVGVRGLDSRYNIVTLNNRIIATDDDGRDLAFDIFPADVISGADVLKSPQASALEGSIGGTINLRSAHAFDNPGFHTAVRAEENYNDMSKFKGSKASAFVSDTFADNTIGVLLGVVLSNQKTRTDSLNYNTYDPSNPGVWPLDSDTPVVAECCISFGSVIEEKKRTAVTGSLEWKPNDAFSLTLDGLFSRLRDPQVAYNQAYYPDFTLDGDGNPEWSNVVVKNGLVQSFTMTNFDPEMVNNTIDRKVSTYLVGLNAKWNVNDRLSLAMDAYTSLADRPEGGTDAFVTAGLVSPDENNHETLNWSNNPGGLPNISVTLPGGVDFAQALASGQLNNNYWNTHYLGLNGFSVHDRVNGLTLDGTLKLDWGPVSSVKFGAAETQRQKWRADVDNDWTGGSSQYNLYNTIGGGPVVSFGSLGANVISFTQFPNYMQGAGGTWPTTVAVFSVPSLLSALQLLNGQPNPSAPPGFPSNYDFSYSLPQYNAVNSYSVTENTVAAYGELNFKGEDWGGNVGLRVVHTNTSASTAVNEIQTITIADTSIPTNPAFVGYSDATPITTKGSYTIPLPSANFQWWVLPKLQLRLGVAETMTRPELNQLAPTRTDNALNRVYEVTYDGNASLRPIKAWQGDVSVEWYYQKNAALTMAIFGKKIKDFITQGTQNNVDIGAKGYFNGDTVGVPVLFTVYGPINGDKGYAEGIELSWEHVLENGLGVRAQYTHNWTKAYIDGQYVGQLEGVSPSTASVGGIYEAHHVSASVTWDYAGSFVAQTETEVQGWSAISKPLSWVTATLGYEFMPGFKVYFEGRNLANAIPRTFLNGRDDAIWASGTTTVGSSVGQGYTAYGRTFMAGVSYRF